MISSHCHAKVVFLYGANTQHCGWANKKQNLYGIQSELGKFTVNNIDCKPLPGDKLYMRLISIKCGSAPIQNPNGLRLRREKFVYKICWVGRRIF